MLQQYNSKFSLSLKGLNGIGYKNYALAIVAFSAVIRLIPLEYRYFWCDEASSVLTSRYDLGALLYHASFDVHPPLYYLLLHGWMVLFGDSIMAARLLSLVFGVATVALAIRFTSYFANQRAALIAGWLMAIMPIAVRYSQEARMYALMGLLVMSGTMALAMWLKTPNNRRYLVLYALLMVLSFYTHYFAIFTLIAHWLVVLVLSCRREGEHYIKQPAWWLANTAIGVLYIPWLLVLFNLLAHLDELRVGGDVGWIPQVTWSDLPAMYWRFLTSHDGSSYPMVIRWLLPMLFLGLCALLIKRRETSMKFDLLLLSGIFVPVTLVFAISWISPMFILRYFYSAALGIPLVLGVLIDRMKNRVSKVCLLLFFSLLFACGVHNDYPSEKDDFKIMVNHINNNYQPNDAVVIGSMFHYLSYVYYNKKDYRAWLYTPAKPNGSSGKPNAYGFGTFFHDRAEQTYVDKLSALSQGYRRVWLVSGGDFNQDFGHLPPGWVNTAILKSGNFEYRLFVVSDTITAH